MAGDVMDRGGSAVRLERLSKSFGAAGGVREIDLDVEPSQVFGFLGPNGAGKSTTIRMMLGLYRPDSGRAVVLGVDVSDPGAAAGVRRRIGYLPGDLVLYPQLTGGETLARLASLRGGVDERVRDELVDRLGAELGRPLRALSKGNRQKIGLIAAFMHRPELLVLDEPTSGLDPLLQHEFATLLEESVAGGATVFLSSHDLAEVQRLAHRVAIIKEGRIVADDTVEALRARAPRTVELTFSDDVDPADFASIDGSALTTHAGRRATFRVTGEVAPLLSAALRHRVVDLEAHTADLDDLFLDYYASAPAADREEASHAR